MACTIIVSAGASQALVGRFGVRRVLLLGLVLLTAGLLFFTQVSPHGTYLGDLAPGFVLAGIGLGFAFIPVTIAALMGITDDEAGLASGPHQHVAADRRRRRRRAASDRVHEPDGRAPGERDGAHDVAFTDGLSRAFLVGAVMAVIGLVAAVVLDPRTIAGEVARPPPRRLPSTVA